MPEKACSVRCHGCGWAIWGITVGAAEGFFKCPACGDRKLSKTGVPVGEADASRLLDARAIWPKWFGNGGYL